MPRTTGVSNSGWSAVNDYEKAGISLMDQSPPGALINTPSI